jgi:hypothetical protein
VPMESSSSARRALRASGSKVITDPVQLGPDLLHLSLKGGAIGHQFTMVATGDARLAPWEPAGKGGALQPVRCQL